MRRKVYFDGGCRPNPGRMEAAVVIAGQAHVFNDLGRGSSEEAEWHALVLAMRLAGESGFGDAVFFGDSRVVIDAAKRLSSDPGKTAAQVRADSVQGAFLRACEDTMAPHLRWVRRTQNLAGIALGRRHPR